MTDYGALYHMTESLDMRKRIENIVPSHVGLPNGVQTTALKHGCIILGPNCIFNNVLYEPKSSYNLIYVAQLVYSLRCQVLFTDELCIIQDCTSRTLIDLGKQEEGVYMYHPVHSLVFAIGGNITQILLHQRLGHPVNNLNISSLSIHKSSYENKDNKFYDIFY